MTIPVTTSEQQQIDRANASGLSPAVFMHGLWLLGSSWDPWRALFEGQGYTTLAPGWPDDPETVQQANQDPEVFAHKRIKQVTDHYVDIIRQLKTKPAIIGHSSEYDHTVPWAIAHASYKQQEKNRAVTEIKEIPGRGHSLTRSFLVSGHRSR